MKFQDLNIGDMFNTYIARWVKISDTEAICVMSGMVAIGKIEIFDNFTRDLIILYSSNKYDV